MTRTMWSATGQKTAICPRSLKSARSVSCPPSPSDQHGNSGENYRSKVSDGSENSDMSEIFKVRTLSVLSTQSERPTRKFR